MTYPNLLQFWKLQRKYVGLQTEIRPFHKVKARALTELVLGTLPTPNLMILEPPRCGKTDLGVRAFVPWGMSFFPDSEYILTSYGSELATSNSVYIRDSLGSDWYRSIIDSEWGAHVDMVGEKAGGRQDYFKTIEGGSVKAVGVGGGITGFGAGKLREEFGGCIVIDDPLKAQDARSAAMRQSCIDWYHGTLESRRNRKDDPKTPVLLIMQRLHPNDLAGHFLQTERDKWTVIQLPAHDEYDTIWPGRIGMQEMLEMKEARPDEYWAQYMQEPTESQSTIFKKAWWRYWVDREAVERRCTIKYITADTAFKAKDSSDWSVLQCWGFESTKGAYLLDQERGRWEFPTLMKKAKDFWIKHSQPGPGITPATEFWIEDKASGTSLAQTLRTQEQIPARDWTPTDKTSPDKVGRANQCTLSISQGRVFLPHPSLPGYKWVDGFINEHEAFTTDDSHLHDDQIDADTMAQLIWQQRGGGRGELPIWDSI